MAAPVARKRRVQPVLSSLPLQILLYLNGWYFAVYWIGEVFMFIYKSDVLPYPSTNLIAEVFLLLFLACLEVMRLLLGKKGNLTERKLSLILSILLSIPVIVGVIYLILWQTYVLRLEIIVGAIQLAFLIFELLFGIIAVITFARAEVF